MRLERTAAADPRYRGAVGAREPEAYAVSRVERYLECPFKYFAGHVLKLDEERDDESGLTPQERGQLLHEVFEAFFAEWRAARRHHDHDCEPRRGAWRCSPRSPHRLLQGLPEGDRALERTYLLGSAAAPGLAERAFAFEIEHGVGVVERLLEYQLEGAFRFEGDGGRRDVRASRQGGSHRSARRTARCASSTTSSDARRSRRGRCSCRSTASAPQQQLDGRHGRSWTARRGPATSRSRRRTPFVELVGRSRQSLTKRCATDSSGCSTRRRAIERGEFPPSPDEPFLCTRCGYPACAARTTSAMSRRDGQRRRRGRVAAVAVRRAPTPVAPASPAMPATPLDPDSDARAFAVDPAQQRRARSVGRHREDVGAGRPLRQPAEGRRRSRQHPGDHVHAEGRRGDARADHPRAAARGRPIRVRLARAGWSSAIGSATSRSARSTRSACRCCASSRSRRTSIPASTWPTRPKCRGSSPRSLDRSLRILVGLAAQRAGRRAGARAARASRERAKGWRRCSIGGSSPGTRSIGSSRAARGPDRGERLPRGAASALQDVLRPFLAA